MNNALQFMEDFQSKLKKMKSLVVGAYIALAVVCSVSVLGALWVIKSSQDHIWILDNGSVLSAIRAENAAQRDQEAYTHLKRFHELFFTVSPDEYIIKETVEKQAIPLGDASVSNYYEELKSKGYFSSIISKGSSKSIQVDNIEVDMSRHPYPARVTGYLYTVNSSDVTRQPFESTCRLREVGARTYVNPNGLLIENFIIKFGTAELVHRRANIQ